MSEQLCHFFVLNAQDKHLFGFKNVCCQLFELDARPGPTSKYINKTELNTFFPEITVLLFFFSRDNLILTNIASVYTIATKIRSRVQSSITVIRGR